MYIKEKYPWLDSWWVALIKLVVFIIAMILSIKSTTMAFIMLIVLIVAPLLSQLSKLLTSITSFLKYGIYIISMIISIILIFLVYFFNNIGTGKYLTVYFTFCIVLLFIWGFYCLLANSRVSQALNTSIAAILAIINLFLTMLIDFNIFNYLFAELPSQYTTMLNDLGYTANSFSKLIVDLITFPFLITNLVTVALTTLKRYWIDKYNNGEDITQEKIDELYHQKYGV